MPVTFNLKVLALNYSKTKLLTFVFPRDIHYLVIRNPTGSLNKDLRKDVAVHIQQLDNIGRLDKVEGLL